MSEIESTLKDDIEIGIGINRRILVWGFIEKVPLEHLAQMALNEKAKIFYRKFGKRRLLIAYKFEEMNAYIGDEAHLLEVVTGVLYSVLPPKSAYKRCLVYNHGRKILSYQDLEVNGSEGDQAAGSDPVQTQGTQIIFVFDYPSEAVDTILIGIAEHERIAGSLTRKKKSKKGFRAPPGNFNGGKREA